MMKGMRYVRYEQNHSVGYGILEEDTVKVLDKNFLDGGKETGKIVLKSEIRLLPLSFTRRNAASA